MRFVQFMRRDDDQKRLGVLSEDGNSLIELSGGACVSNDMTTFIAQDISMEKIRNKLEHLRSERITNAYKILPPVTNPGKIICVGLNYLDQCEEQQKPVPKEPMFFSKFNNSLTGPNGNIIAHTITEKLDWEVELVVVIGKVAHNVARKDAMDYVFGYTVAQDISARDWQKEHNAGQFLIGKSMDSFCPLGPAIVHKSLIVDPYNLYMKTVVNGVVKQNGNTNKMIFKIDDIIARLAQCITLDPGDIILTGTPKGVGVNMNPQEFLKPGDVLESEIQYVGKLRNLIVASK